MSNGPRQGNRLRALHELTTTHVGRTVTIGDLTGSLTGLLPVGDRVVVGLLIGGSRVFLDALPADTHIEIHQKDTRP